MGGERESLKPVEGANRALRSRLDLKGEFALAVLPTLTVLGVLALLETFSRQRLLFASLASSAFLIYLDPLHGMNTVRTLIVSHTLAALAGLLAYWPFGHGYLAGAVAMVATIALMILLDVVHPPAISTALTFAFRAESEDTLILFALALGIIAILVSSQRMAVWLLARLSRA
ncbi:MAG: HPP family protein [Chloroflexota bacterium]|nr:HPP family protein [Chloroflexota bacterium]